MKWLLLVVGLCSCSSSTPSDPSADGGTPKDATVSDTGTIADAAGGGDLPGGPPNPAAGVQVLINGQPRTFDGPAAWFESPNPDGGRRMGFQTNASGGDSTFVMAVFDAKQTNNTCVDGGGLSLIKGPLTGPSAEWGSRAMTKTCTITLTQYGPRKGDHVKGTFSAELDLSEGSSPVKHLSLTNGTFDLIQFADTP